MKIHILAIDPYGAVSVCNERLRHCTAGLPLKSEGIGMNEQPLPRIIQGGMGVAVSSWPLAKSVAMAGQLGVVSGTALDVVLVRRLQNGDLDGSLRRALDEFPFPEMSARILERYYVPRGKPKEAPYDSLSLLTHKIDQARQELIAVASFAEVCLAKEGHEGLIGINFLEKIQLPLLPALFGAMLAGVDVVLMGAGIPISIPGILDGLAAGEQVELPLHVSGLGQGEKISMVFDPEAFTQNRVPWLRRPVFLPIVSSATLATMLIRKANGRIDGFIVEGPTAGGHNAPPRGAPLYNEFGEPIYGDRDQVDLAAMRATSLPFWLAGSYGTPERLRFALDQGAAGVQVGTAFAFCKESGLREDLREQVVQAAKLDACHVHTDPLASPAGFPFKVLSIPGTMSEKEQLAERLKVCDLGFLRQGYRASDGTIGWRCPAEPVASFVRKEGTVEETVGRKCLCNGLIANVGMGQVRKNGELELPLVTCGDDVSMLASYLPNRQAVSYSAHDVIQFLLSAIEPEDAIVPSLMSTTES